MLLNQLSVFLENKPGTLSELTRFLADREIDIKALCISETADYGIVRIIVDTPEDTLEQLKSSGYTCKLTKVICARVPDQPGALTKILALLAENGISLKYSYAFYSKDKGSAFIILRVDNNDFCTSLLKRNGIDIW